MSTATGKLRIATRQSRLALWQAEHVAPDCARRIPGWSSTSCDDDAGDRILDRSLAQVGGKGLFIKELEVAISEVVRMPCIR
jgi:hydroxymethylbilane synthase